ncbi:V-type ATP synthase subunit F [Streptococcus halichoeri]|uniref:V-type ATP synthase subunit F n=1 Tax=Streptococcus halichoeri TaxID=254785 RepID=UPI000DB3D653|nr:V-type ATP synthase subunit F [Streptococcus halichoeri]PZO94176.1 MAG: V-type ATP synthase subunit F [Streptococcus pyogenes]
MANKAYKIGVIGNRDAILPFHMIGFQTFPVLAAQEATNTLRKLAQSDFGIIYITEDIAAMIPETLAHYEGQLLPAVTIIPTHKADLQLGMKGVQERVERAVGQNIL